MEMSTNTVSVVNHPHPVCPVAGRELRQHVWRAGETMRELLLRQGLDAQQEIAIYLNGRLLTVDEWDSVCPQPDDLINVQAVVSGGGGDEGGGSNVGKAILSIVIAVVAWEVGGWAALEWGFAEGTASYMAVSAGVSAVVSMAGNMVVGALFRPSGKSLSNASGESATSPTYSLSGGSNSLRPYEPMPVVFGSHRIFPDYGAKPYTEFQGEDQYLYQLFNFGLSSLALSDFRIGETLLSDFDEVTQVWSDASGALPGFPGNVDSLAGATLEIGAAWTVRTSAPQTLRLAVDLETQAYYSTGQSTEPVVLVLEAEYASAGSGLWLPMATREIVTTTDHHWSLSTQISDGTEYGLVDSFVRFGGLGAGEHGEGDSEQIGDAGDAFTPQPFYGQWHWTENAVAAARGWPMPPPVTTYSYSNTFEVLHTTQKTQRNSLIVDVASGQYDVRCRLVSARRAGGPAIAEGDARGGWQASFSTLRSYQEDGASYLGQRRMGLVIKASGQLNGVVQQLSCLAEAACLVWDGTDWVWGNTRNPAWWFADFARGRRNTAGAQLYGCMLDNAAIDFDSIIAWGAFCQAEGLTCDLVLDRAQSASDVFALIAKCGFASPTWASGKLGVIWDKRNASPVAAFGMSNIIKGSFSVQYLNENLAEEIVVSYVDRDQDWGQKQVRVTVPGVTVPQKTSTVELMGCTSDVMAGKYANYLAAGQFYRKRMVSWETDFEGFVCQRGDVVLLSHDLTQWGYSGRLVAVDGVTVTLERAVPRSGAAEYLMLALPDGTLTTYTVVAGTAATESDTLTLTAPLVLQSGYAPVDHRWFFSPLATPGKKVKIVSVRPVSQSRIALVATDEDPAFYTAWDGTFTAPGNTTLLSSGPPVIDGVTISETILKIGDSYVIELSLAISARPGYASALLRLSIDGAIVDETQVFGTRYSRIVPSSGEVVVSLLPINVAAEQGVAFTMSHTLAGFVGALPRPLSPTIFASADAAGQVNRAKVVVRFAEMTRYPVSGLAFFLSTFVFENKMTISAGGTGATLTIAAAQVTEEGTITVLAGSTPERIVATTIGAPFDTTVNHGGFWWGALPGGEWRKITGIDATAYLFSPPHDVTPVAGMLMNYASIAWADERNGDFRLAILQDGANYEIIKWAAVDQDGVSGPFRLTGCLRGQEGTTPINADGKTLHYFPAPGQGTKTIVFPAESFIQQGDFYVAETDIDFIVPPGHFASLSAGVFYQQPNGEFIRSVIVPAIYGGPL